jgi:DNA-directed RNA polymerase sigma subunit (sigma70/sigma32)
MRARAAAVHPTLPFERDEAAQRFVEEHPEGASLNEIGEALGVTYERARQIEAAAMAKLRGIPLRLDTHLHGGE